MTINRIFLAFMALLACATVLAAGGTMALAAESPSGSDPAATDETPTDLSKTKPVTRSKPVLRIADRSVNFGGRFRLSGKTGNPYKGQVRVQARHGKRWFTLRKVGTDTKGRFKVGVRARTSTSLRVRANDGGVSKASGVTVIGHLKLGRTARYVRLGNALVVRGTVVPRGARTLKLRVRGGAVLTTRSRANGRFAFRWKPRSNGDYSYRIWAHKSPKSTGNVTRHRRISALRPGHASYYGPGLYGNGVACGGTLTPSTRGVAHKYLPCGTRVTLQYGKRTVVARVIDRGPYIAGRDWDLTEQTRNDLGFGGVGVVWTNK